MKMLKQLIVPIKKFSKGMLALMTANALVILSVFIFDSCKKSEYEKSPGKKANDNFISSLQANKKTLSSVAFRVDSKQNKIGKKNVMARYADPAPTPDEVPVYIQFPADESNQTNAPFQKPETMEELVELIHSTDAIIQYEPTSTNSGNQINLPIETIRTSLNPLIQESKQYLYAKGFTEQDIQQMIKDENAEETDLVPFVIALSEIESSQMVAVTNNYSKLLPFNSAYAKLQWSDVGTCAMKAIGADILAGLYQSSASVWSVAVLKKAFGTVAKKMVGPVGAAIAAIEFGWCLWSNS